MGVAAKDFCSGDRVIASGFLRSPTRVAPAASAMVALGGVVHHAVAMFVNVRMRWVICGNCSDLPVVEIFSTGGSLVKAELISNMS